MFYCPIHGKELNIKTDEVRQYLGVRAMLTRCEEGHDVHIIQSLDGDITEVTVIKHKEPVR